jgi:hypothetical protein
VDDSPLQDMAILANPKKSLRMVMKEGVIYHRSDL